MSETLLDVKAVMKKTSLGRTKIYELVNSGGFPEPRRLGPQIVRWREAEIDAWIVSLPGFRANANNERAR
jgi:prophage regulatory protein